MARKRDRSVATARLVVRADHLDDAGAGVGVAGGLTVHAADLLPGEAAEVEVTHQSPHRAEAWARIVARRGELSGDRTPPACPGWGRCGGCGWQHLAYPAQLAEKRQRVARALAGALPPGVEVAPVVPSPAALGYRAKGKYVAGRDRGAGGRILLGAYAPRSHDVIDTAGCRVVAPLIDELRGRARDAAHAAGLEPYDERTGAGVLRYVVIRATRDRRALVVLVVRSSAADARVRTAARAIAADPRVAGVLRLDNDRSDGAIVDGDGDGHAVVGADHVVERVAGVEVALGAGEFAQVNPDQADAMYARVAALAAVGPGDLAADVYAGLGGITFALAAAGAHVTAIEHDASAVAALAAAAARAGLAARVDARAGDAATLAALAGPLTAVVVNPPRKGLSAEARAAVAAAPAARLVYVSCGPESLGRDLAALAAAGWTVDTVEPFDLMPGTSQVETVVRAVRKVAPAGGAP
ncbi:MAG TPA: 23S rRNA (uracil(1939)-C(5))-methyltransferase RlmD [Kofleriaceae bacterium]|nr:23S rRNA (uracil(1939)-C(5))-methyltransferase RlmD [Kofleriaceae bacterium]